MFQGKTNIDHDTGNTVIIVLFCFAATATFIMLFLQKPEHEGQKRDEASLWASRVSFIAEAGPKEAFIKSLKLAIKPRILMLCPLFCYFGKWWQEILIIFFHFIFSWAPWSAAPCSPQFSIPSFTSSPLDPLNHFPQFFNFNFGLSFFLLPPTIHNLLFLAKTIFIPSFQKSKTFQALDIFNYQLTFSDPLLFTFLTLPLLVSLHSSP